MGLYNPYGGGCYEFQYSLSINVKLLRVIQFFLCVNFPVTAFRFWLTV